MRKLPRLGQAGQKNPSGDGVSPLQWPLSHIWLLCQEDLAFKVVTDCHCPGWKAKKVSPKEQGVCLLSGIQKPSGLPEQGAIIPTIILTI